MTEVVHLRPHSSILSQGAIASGAFLIPVFLVLYYLTVPSGPWVLIMGLQVVAMVVLAFASYRAFITGIWVDPTGIAERGILRKKTRFGADQIGSVVFITVVYSWQPAGSPQLFVCDHDGKQLVRMRGTFYSREAMETVASTLDVPFSPLGQPLSFREVRELFPAVGYWFERRPVLAAALFIASIVVIGLVTMIVNGSTTSLSGN